MEEERRLYFVGLTRAKSSLTLCCGGAPSPFLRDLPGTVERIDVKGSPAAQVKQLSFFG
jgi:superfamily I DNA/RNA helicase